MTFLPTTLNLYTHFTDTVKIPNIIIGQQIFFLVLTLLALLTSLPSRTSVEVQSLAADSYQEVDTGSLCGPNREVPFNFDSFLKYIDVGGLKRWTGSTNISDQAYNACLIYGQIM